VDPSPQCEGVFQLFDYDRSGQIDVREFMISLANFSGATKVSLDTCQVTVYRSLQQCFVILQRDKLVQHSASIKLFIA
jgi:Ca2+-binding EF-hand superfamily protein